MHVFAHNLTGFPNLLHGFCGVPSTSPDAFKDPQEATPYRAKNCKAALEALDIQTPYVLLHQTHGTNVVEVTQNFLASYKEENPPEGDILITAEKNIAIGVRTADCGPLLWYENKKGIVAATHAGWRGAFKGVVEKTLHTILGMGGKKENIFVALGPTIHAANYDVGIDFEENTLRANPAYKRFLLKKETRTTFDLPNFLMYQLKELNLPHTLWTGHNTFEKHFFSRRRSLAKKEYHGSNYSFIVQNKNHKKERLLFL